jgi:hypothetical protein
VIEGTDAKVVITVAIAGIIVVTAGIAGIPRDKIKQHYLKD